MRKCSGGCRKKLCRCRSPWALFHNHRHRFPEGFFSLGVRFGGMFEERREGTDSVVEGSGPAGTAACSAVRDHEGLGSRACHNRDECACELRRLCALRCACDRCAVDEGAVCRPRECRSLPTALNSLAELLHLCCDTHTVLRSRAVVEVRRARGTRSECSRAAHRTGSERSSSAREHGVRDSSSKRP